jgi:hypothetical protein
MEEIQTNQNIKKRLLIALFLLLIIIFAVVAAFLYNKGIFQQDNNQTENTIFKGEAVLNLKYGDNDRWFSGETKEGMTFFDVLQTASITGKFELSADSEIISLDGFKKESSAEWRCYLNGELVKERLAQKIIHSGDRLFCQHYK